MRWKTAFATGIAVSLALGTGVLSSACKSNDATQPAAQTASEPKAAPGNTDPPKGVQPPASHRLAKVTANMSPQQVQEIMGQPTGEASYPSAKTFMPYNFGNDTGNRVEYKYKGEGRIVFAVPRYGGNMKVVRIDYDPAEDGN